VLGSGGRRPGPWPGGGSSLISGTFGKALRSGGAFLPDAPIGEVVAARPPAPSRYSTALARPAAAALAALELAGRRSPRMGASFRRRARHWRGPWSRAGWGGPAGETAESCTAGGPSPFGALACIQQLERAACLSVAIGRPPCRRQLQAAAGAAPRSSLRKPGAVAAALGAHPRRRAA